MKRLLPLIIFMVLFPLASQEVSFFRSNPSGMALEKIGVFRMDEFEWVLMTEDSEGEFFSILYRDNEVIKESTRFYEAGEIIRIEEKEGEVLRSFFYNDGVIQKEATRFADSSIEERVYIYRNMRLRTIRVTIDEVLIYSDNYFLDPEGRLLNVERVFPDDSGLTTRFGYSGGNLSREWHEGEDREELFLIKEGSVDEKEIWIGGILSSREIWEEIEGIPTLHISYPGEEREVYRQFDQSGNIIHEILHQGDESETLDYVYEDDMLIIKTRRSSGKKETWNYTWLEERLYLEEYYRNLRLVKKIVYIETGLRREMTYRNGEILATVTYQDDIPVSTRSGGDETDVESGKEALSIPEAGL